MDYRACFTCELLFEVSGVGEAACPRCGRILEPHQPSQIFSVNEPAPMEEDSMDERTRMVSRLDPALLEGIPDPELERTERAGLPAPQEMTKVSASGFGEVGDPAGETIRRSSNYRPAVSHAENQERRVPLGRAVQHSDGTHEVRRDRSRITAENQRPNRSYGASTTPSSDRPSGEVTTGIQGVSYRAADGFPTDVTAKGGEGATTVRDPRAHGHGRREGHGPSQQAAAHVAQQQKDGRDGFTAVDGRDAHGGRRSIHRRKTSNEHQQGPVAVEIPVPSRVPPEDPDSMDRTRVLDVGQALAEKTELLQQSELDAAVQSAQRMSGGVPIPDDEEEARTRVVRRSDEFDAVLQIQGGQQDLRTDAVNPAANQVKARPQPFPSPAAPRFPDPTPNQGPSPSPRSAPDPRPRKGDWADLQGTAPAGGAGPSPLPRRVTTPTPTGGRSPMPRPVRSAEPKSGPEPVAVPRPRASRPSDRRSAHADYFETGIDEDVDLTDALDAIVGDQLIQNLEAKRSTISRQEHHRRRARAQWLLVLLPICAIALLLLILLPDGEETSTVRRDAAVVDTVAPGKTLLSAIGRVGLELPRIRGTQSLDEAAPYLAASGDSLRTSFGSVLGLASSRIPDHLLAGDVDAQWIKPLKAAIERDTNASKDVFILALDGQMTAGAMAQFGRSATQAGFDRLALTFDRQEVGGGVGTLEFRLGRGKLPSAGGALIRVGNLGVHTRIESRDGRLLSEKLPEVANGEDGNLDLESIDARLLDQLTNRHSSAIAANRSAWCSCRSGRMSGSKSPLTTSSNL